MADAAVTSKGQITMPVDIHRALELRERDRVVFTPVPDGTLGKSCQTLSS